MLSNLESSVVLIIPVQCRTYVAIYVGTYNTILNFMLYVCHLHVSWSTSYCHLAFYHEYLMHVMEYLHKSSTDREDHSAFLSYKGTDVPTEKVTGRGSLVRH